MQIHSVLAANLTGLLGMPERVGSQHSWHVRLDSVRINVMLNLPTEARTARVWVFDPRRAGEDSAKDFCVDSLEQVDAVVAAVAQRVSSVLQRGPSGGYPQAEPHD